MDRCGGYKPPKTITLIGSTKFKAEFLRAAEQLTLAGHIVLIPLVYSHADSLTLTEKQRTRLEILHMKKIEMSDLVLVITVDNYCGEGTERESLFARAQHIPIEMFNPTKVKERYYD